jgi:hypothetical protein
MVELHHMRGKSPTAVGARNISELFQDLRVTPPIFSFLLEAARCT